MRRVARYRPSPAIIVAVLAAVAALAGTALAGTDVTSSAVSKKKVKKIAKKQAKKQINKLAPGLSVAHADTADSASTADSFGSMTPHRVDPFTLNNGGSRTIGTFGAFTLRATCTINQANTDTARIGITTSENNSAFVGEAENADFDVGDNVPYVVASVMPTGTVAFEEDSGAAVSPSGSEILGHQLYAGVNVLGQPGRCRFGGVILEV